MNHKELESEDKMDITEEEHCSVIQNSSQEMSHLKNKMLEDIIHSKAIFKFQHKDEPELSDQEKRTIALNLLEKSPSMFLTRFGVFLNAEHLPFLRSIKFDDQETSFYHERLERNFDNEKRILEVKNRRFQAFKSLVAKGEFFSEKEMMKRNPLVYELYVGKYLTEEERKARLDVDSDYISLIHSIMERIDRDIMIRYNQLKQGAKNVVDKECDSDESSEEGSECESEKESEIENKLEDTEVEYDTDEESEEENNSLIEEKTEENSQSVEKKENLQEKEVTKNWGEISQPKYTYEAETREKKKYPIKISDEEKNTLAQEFISLMYQRFLDGEEFEFDYSTVDNNEDYDYIDIRTQDEEEKYFDCESPETIVPEKVLMEDDSEDELEAYMKTLEVYSPTKKQDYDNVQLRTQDEGEKYFDYEFPKTIVPEKVLMEVDSEDKLEA